MEKCDFFVVYIPENPFGIKELVQVNGSACIQGQSQKRHQPGYQVNGNGYKGGVPVRYLENSLVGDNGVHDAVILDNDSLALGGGAGCEHDERVILLPAKGGNGAEIGSAQVGKTKSVLTPSGLHQMDAGGFQRYEPVIKFFITQDVLEIGLCCQ